MERCIQLEKAEIQEDVAPQLSETEISSVVAAGGGRYVGILKELPGNMDFHIRLAELFGTEMPKLIERLKQFHGEILSISEPRFRR
jgi:hypothetical protein